MGAAQAIAYLRAMNMDYKLTESKARFAFGCGALDSLATIEILILISPEDGPLVLQVDIVHTELPALLGIELMHPLMVLIDTEYCARILRKNG